MSISRLQNDEENERRWKVEELVRQLLRRLNAKNRIITAHQTGLPPKESTFQDLASTEGIEQQALAWLGGVQHKGEGEDNG